MIKLTPEEICSVMPTGIVQLDDKMDFAYVIEQAVLAKLQSMTDEQVREEVEAILHQDEEVCPRCEGNGRLYADGKSHFYSENAPTILCQTCGGTGHLYDSPSIDQILPIIAAQKAAARQEVIKAVIDWLETEITNQEGRTAGEPKLKEHLNAVERMVLQTVINALQDWQKIKEGK